MSLLVSRICFQCRQAPIVLGLASQMLSSRFMRNHVNRTQRSDARDEAEAFDLDQVEDDENDPVRLVSHQG
jgi:hypothetical protein